MKKYQVWTCKIVVPEDAYLPEGFDLPPRRAAINAVDKENIPVIACFSGWDGQLIEVEEAMMAVFDKTKGGTE